MIVRLGPPVTIMVGTSSFSKKKVAQLCIRLTSLITRNICSSFWKTLINTISTRILKQMTNKHNVTVLIFFKQDHIFLSALLMYVCMYVCMHISFDCAAKNLSGFPRSIVYVLLHALYVHVTRFFDLICLVIFHMKLEISLTL